MRASDLTKYPFSESGFNRLVRNGLSYDDGLYDFRATRSIPTLSTLSTGALPSTHGAVGTTWYDYVTGRSENLTIDPEKQDPEYRHNAIAGRSAKNLVAQTLSEALTAAEPSSRSVTIALNPESAIALAGSAGQVYWMDASGCNFSTSTAYAPVLPAWVKTFNEEKNWADDDLWRISRPEEQYRNSKRADILLPVSKNRTGRISRIPSLAPGRTPHDRLLYSPVGNDLVFALARQAVAQLDLGGRPQTDLLILQLDAAEAIAQAYGPESMEYEDMLYRLDTALSDFLTYLYAQRRHEEVAIVLTAAHGTSPSTTDQKFNTEQFRVVVNGFLSARYGVGQWVLGYADQAIWLNHNLIYEKKLPLHEIQEETASFALQFRGVAQALSATALRSGGFSNGYGQKMQNSFYPRRSGDVLINLMPGWIELNPEKRSDSGSAMAYDTRVPLVFYGAGIPTHHAPNSVPMTAVAPTLARLLEIAPPMASDENPLREL